MSNRILSGMSVRNLFIILCLAGFMCVGWPQSPLFADETVTASLFLESTGTGDNVPEGFGIVRHRAVDINFNALCDINEAGKGKLFLDLFPGHQYRARIHETGPTYGGGYYFSGKVEGAGLSDVVLVTKDNVLMGNISLNGRFYQVRVDVSGGHYILEIDQRAFPPEMCPYDAGIVEPQSQTGTAVAPQLSSALPPTSGDSAAYIDVLVAYTDDARAVVGSTAAMETLINLAVSESNQGYANSGVSHRLRLVHTGEVSYDESGFNWTTTLSRFRSTSDGFMDEVHTWRETYGADEMVLLVKSSGYCGLAYVMTSVSTSFASSAFALVNYNCATGYYSFAHELGHNMGSAHDRANASVAGAYDYSYGYQAPNEAFRTIMAYDCPGSCTRVNYWSNPDKTYGGQAMGVLYTDASAADNRRSLNNNAYTVANFRQAVSSPTITVTSPNGGESWAAGSSQTITWSSTGTVGNVAIHYSTNNGSSWSTVTASTANDGSYAWTVPSTSSTTCLVRVREASDSDPTDTSNAVFTITASSSAGVTVTSPNGGESWTAGSSQAITWSSTGTVGNVAIHYSTNNGSNWTTITTSTANDGSYTWTVPSTTSTSCLVRVREALDSSPTDTSDAVFTITAASSAAITVTSPNGGESYSEGDTALIKWTGSSSISSVKIEYSANNGGSWSTIVSSTANDGLYGWGVPNIVSDTTLIKISDAADGSPSDTSDGVFTVGNPPTITLTSPNGGEKWIVGETKTITWERSDKVGSVTLEYSLNNGSSWTTIITGTSNDGMHSWKLPSTESDQCLVRIKETADGSPSDTSDAVFTLYTPNPSIISLNRTELHYAALTSGVCTSAQTLSIDNTGGGTMAWSISDNAGWLQCSPTSGTGAARVSVTVDPTGLAVGDYSAYISVSDSNASNSPQSVAVRLSVLSSSTSPTGYYSSPADGATVTSSIPVTGWVVDDIDVMSVKIYNGSSYLGDAVFVDGARTDIEAAYPNHPKSYQAGWGYMLLTNFLPNGGNGWYTINAVAVDAEGHQVNLGSKKIYCDNNNAKKPFGAIDTPTQGGSISGSAAYNWGWVLTPNPDRIPTDGSTLSVWVNGVKIGAPTYGLYRKDIATLFPGYANSAGPIGLYLFDTTRYANGVHNMHWLATDSGGDTDGIGSRYFSILNTGGDSNVKARHKNTAHPLPALNALDQLAEYAVDTDAAVAVRTGYDDNRPAHAAAKAGGVSMVDTNELERVVLQLNQKGSKNNDWHGYLLAERRLRPLPIGSTLIDGVYYWQPGVGFVGDYRFIFVNSANNSYQMVQITIKPKFQSEDPVE